MILKRAPIAFVLFFLVMLEGCTQKSGKVTVTDRAGYNVSLQGELNRIVSTAPSNTEIILGLGLGEKLIATDKYSADVEGIPANITLIDFAYPDGEVIVSLDPDLIIAAGHNRTVAGDDPFQLMRDVGIPVVYIPTSRSIDGIYDDIRFIAELFGVKERGEALIREMSGRVNKIAEIGSTITNKRSVYFEMSSPPFMVSVGDNTYISEMITLIGAYNIFAGEQDWFSPGVESIIDRNPDVILIMGVFNNDFFSEVQSRPGFEHITAVKNGDIYTIDVNSLSHPSQHIILALEQMARAVYPEAYEKHR
jgi:iron complex transport system substrate-binding protein